MLRVTRFNDLDRVLCAAVHLFCACEFATKAVQLSVFGKYLAACIQNLTTKQKDQLHINCHRVAKNGRKKKLRII